MIIKYLWYKLYRASLKSSLKEIPIVLAGALFSLFIHLNIVSVLLSKLDIFPYIYQSNNQALIASIVLMVLSWIYFSGKRARIIIDLFSQETNRQRIKGNIYVIVYLVISVALTFGLMFYKPGYLPVYSP